MLTPTIHVGRVPAFRSRADIGRALQVLALLETYRAPIEAARDKKISDATAAATERLQIDLGDGEPPVPLAEYRSAIATELGRWALASPAEFGEARTLEFPHGKVSIRKSPDSIGFVGDEKSVVEKLRAKLADPIARMLRRLGVAVAIACRVKVEPDRQAMMAALKAGQVKPAALKRLGFVRVVGEDKVAYELCHSATAPSEIASEPT